MFQHGGDIPSQYIVGDRIELPSTDMIPVYDKVTQTGGMYDKVRKIFLPAVGSVNIVVYDANGNAITG